MNEVLLGFEIATGERVSIPITHAVFSALTGGGKTEAVLRCVAGAAAAGYQVLAIDVKSKPRDFEGAGAEIRPYISESTEPLLVLRMLESVLSGTSLFSRFSTILDACVDAEDDLKNVLKSMEATRDNKKAHPRKRDDAKVLAYLLAKLLEQIRTGSYAKDLDLVDGVNVMNVSNLPLGVQQLVVDSVLRRLLSGKFRRTIVVLEEAINFIPQAEQTQFETSARKFIREGRSAQLFLWASGQALTEMDIAVRKQMRVWILGPQMEEREAEKFRRQVPMKGVDAHEIQNLPTGHFIAAIRRGEEEGGKVEVRRVYAQPTWLPDDVAAKVARGKLTLTHAMKHKRERPRKEERDVDDQEKAELLRTIEELKRKNHELAEKMAAALREVEEHYEGELRKLREESRSPPPPPPSPAPRTSTPGPAAAPRAMPDLDDLHTGADLEPLNDRIVPEDRVRAIVRDELRQASGFRILEVPPARAILKGFAADAVRRIREKTGSLSERQKKILAYLAAKKVAMRMNAIYNALFGYNPNPSQVAELRAIVETGLVSYSESSRNYAYAGADFVREIGSQFDLAEQDVEEALAAIENEFAHVVRA